MNEVMIELPYKLIDINTGGEHFVLQFNSLDDNQTEQSIKTGGLTGKFGIIYQAGGIDCNFECDITVGNVYEFYVSLDDAWDILFGKNAVAVLKNYGTLDRTNLTVSFDKRGHCLVDGFFKNKNNQYKSGISFSFEIDQTYITDILNSMKTFFTELIRVQGHKVFY